MFINLKIRVTEVGYVYHYASAQGSMAYRDVRAAIAVIESKGSTQLRQVVLPCGGVPCVKRPV